LNDDRAVRKTGVTPIIAELGGPHWHANLDMSFVHDDGRTRLAAKAHTGPLQIQKALYPEGPQICHVAVLHPPGGIAAGDRLSVSARLGNDSRVCLTTPGASKWYRSAHAEAQQRLNFSVGAGASLEWLPRESILFDASQVCMTLDVELHANAQFLGWEILCFGRRASGERWQRGRLRVHSTVSRGAAMPAAGARAPTAARARPLWRARAEVVAGSGFEASSIGLAGYSVSATLLCAGPIIEAPLLADCRGTALPGKDSRAGITALPGVLLARYLGHSSEDAARWFTSIWRLLRPALLGVTATAPRLWAC
jgi:urease accessory protein